MLEGSRDSEISQDLILDASTFIQAELQSLTLGNTRLKGEAHSLGEHVKLENLISREPFRQPPPELLNLIFERTIPPLSLLEPTLCAASSSTWCQVFKQKQALISVCKAWYDVGIPFLYEHIQIVFMRQLLLLLRTLGSVETDFKRFVTSIKFCCMIPTSYAGKFEKKLKLLFSLCPNVTCLSYLSSCPLPSWSCLRVLPVHITHLNLDYGVSYKALMDTLKIASPYLVSLSFDNPDPPCCIITESYDHVFQLPNLETLLCALPGDRLPMGVDLSQWNMPRIKRLTLHCYGFAEKQVITICRMHGAGLKFLNIVPFCGGFHNLGRVLDLCPALEHIVIHPETKTSFSLGHQYVKWVDIWEPKTYEKTSRAKKWNSLCENFTKGNFPLLQGVRKLSAPLSHLINLPTIFPPGEVLTPVDSYSYNFLGLNIRHDVGKIHGECSRRPVAGYEDEGSIDHEDNTDDDDEWRWGSHPLPRSDTSHLIDWEVSSDEDAVVTMEAKMVGENSN